MAMRNGRLPDGRPVAKGKRAVLGECTGCVTRAKCGRWRAEFSHKNRSRHVGMFDTKEEARAAAAEAKRRALSGMPA